MVKSGLPDPMAFSVTKFTVYSDPGKHGFTIKSSSEALFKRNGSRVPASSYP